jgi:hypothetical protein
MKKIVQIATSIVFLLLPLLLPAVASALEIAGVQAENATDTSAISTWVTDEPSTSNAEAPCPSVSDTWQITYSEETQSGETYNILKYLIPGAGWGAFSIAKNAFGIGGGSGFMGFAHPIQVIPSLAGAKFLVYPIEVGTSWVSSSDWSDVCPDKMATKTYRWIESVTDTITVPAGTFNNCARVGGYSTVEPAPSGNCLVTEITWETDIDVWYAEGVGPVKAIITDNLGRTYTGELTSYSVSSPTPGDYWPMSMDDTWTFSWLDFDWPLSTCLAAETPAGSNITVSLFNGAVTVTFSQVTVAGYTEINNAMGSPENWGPVPSGFRAVGEAGQITTTAAYSGPVTVDSIYLESMFSNENAITVFGWNGTEWVEANNYVVDTVNNRIHQQLPLLGPGPGFLAEATGETSAGSQVEVPLPNAVVTFDTVLSGGNTTVTTTSENPVGPTPSGFNVAGLFVDITTTANYTGNVTVGISYDPSTPNPQNLRLFHYEGGNWVDVTTWVDTSNHIIYGEVSSLSWFFIGGHWVYVPSAGVPVFPNVYIGIAAALGAGVLAYFVRRRLVRQG